MAPRTAPYLSGLAVWLVTLATALYVKWPDLLSLTTPNPDDALRIVQVRDLLNGQAWWDVSQYRINPMGGGGLMHWSRIVDAPLALGIWGLTPLLGRAGAEIATAALWPMLLLLPLIYCMVRVGDMLGDRWIAYLAAPFLCTNLIILYQFLPARVDHHGWQIWLQAAMLLGAISPRPQHGAWAGLAGAVLLNISLEGLPVITLFAAIFAAQWWWQGNRDSATRLLSYLWVLALAALVLQYVTRGPMGIFSRWCDALSAAWLTPLLVAACLLSAAQWGMTRWVKPRQARSARAFSLILANGAALGAMLYVAPECRAGPFGSLDPLVHDYWYAHVREGLPVWDIFDAVFAYALVPTILGLVGSFLAWRHSPATHRRAWLIILIAVLGSGVVSLFVLRTASAAHVMALPGTAWLFGKAWQRARQIAAAPRRILMSLGCLLLFPPTAAALAGQAIVAALPPQPAPLPPLSETCVTPRSTAGLATLPPQRLFTPLDIAPDLLQRTGHAVIATGHHRNNAAMARVIRAFISPAARAEPLVRQSGATMLVICPAAQEIRNFADAPGGDNLTDDLLAGRMPDWLSPYPLPAASPLRAWWVRPQPVR